MNVVCWVKCKFTLIKFTYHVDHIGYNRILFYLSPSFSLSSLNLEVKLACEWNSIILICLRCLLFDRNRIHRTISSSMWVLSKCARFDRFLFLLLWINLLGFGRAVRACHELCNAKFYVCGPPNENEISKKANIMCYERYIWYDNVNSRLANQNAIRTQQRKHRRASAEIE